VNVEPTRGAKMLFPIRRKPTSSREELVAHWFANHMPLVIQGQAEAAERGRLHAWRYIATLYDPDPSGAHPWDGLAALWWDRPLGRPKAPFGIEPGDTFQQKAEPYTSWATREYVLLDPTEHLDAEPLTLNAPYPMTRSGFFKISSFLQTQKGADHESFFRHWLDVHAPNVVAAVREVGGFGYAVSQSLEPELETYAGLAELWFPDAAAWGACRKLLRPDGMEQWLEGTLILGSHTEMVGIP